MLIFRVINSSRRNSRIGSHASVLKKHILFHILPPSELLFLFLQLCRTSGKESIVISHKIKGWTSDAGVFGREGLLFGADFLIFKILHIHMKH